MSRTVIEETNLKFKTALQDRPITSEIIIHHIGPMGKMDRDKIGAPEIHQWHLAKGWAGIGYHFVIKTNGTIQRGRPRAKKGSHALNGYNSHSIGINVVGNFDTMAPTTAQIDALERLLADLHDLYPEFDKDLNKTIKGHKEVNTTACPGKNLFNRLPTIRAKVTTLLGVTPVLGQ